MTLRLSSRYYPPIPRQPRRAPGGYVYHAPNRGVARLALFEKDGDYAAFERARHEALAEHPIRLLACCLNEAQSERELAALRRCVARGQPFGSQAWQRQTAARLGIGYTPRPRGRPKKGTPQQL